MPDDQQLPREEGAATGGGRSDGDGPDQTREYDPVTDRETGPGPAAGPDETAPLPPADADIAGAPDRTTPTRAPDSTAPDSTAPMPAGADRTAAQGPLGDTADQPAAKAWSARAEVPPAGTQAGYPVGDPAYAPRPATEWEQVEPEDTGRWWLPIVLGLIGLLLLGVLIYGLWLIFAANDESESPAPTVTTSVTPPRPTTQAPATTQPPATATAPVEVVVPPVAGLPVADARDLLDARGLTYRLESRTTDTQPAGTVIETDPPVGARVPTGSEVTIVVAAAPRPPEPPPPPTTTPPATPNG